MASRPWLRMVMGAASCAVLLAGLQSAVAREISPPVQVDRFEPADSLEGNYLAAIVAGAA
jgi:hypothetical protein